MHSFPLMRPMARVRIVAGAIVLTVAGCAPVRGTSAPIRVLVYNIHAGKDAKGVDNLERVAAIVRASKADVVLLQEVDKGTTRSGKVDQPAELKRLTGFYVSFGKTLDYQGGDYGIAILSRWPILSDTLILLPVTPPQDRSGVMNEPRGALRVRIDAPGGELGVINTHIDAGREDLYRLQEVRTLLTVAGPWRDSTGTLIVGGDLNSEPQSAVQAMFPLAGWRDSFKECGRGTGLSFPADVPVKRIDYLMITGDTQCTTASVLDTEASDHRPVLFEIIRGTTKRVR